MHVPKTVANNISDEIVSFLEKGLQYSKDDISLSKLEYQSKKLAQADIVEGYIALAAISMLRGNFDEMRNRYEIARNQGLSAGQRLNYATSLCHAGFFSEAVPIVKSAADSLPDPYFAAIKGAMCFQYRVAIEMIRKAERIKYPVPDKYINFISWVKAIEDSVRNAGLNDDYLASLCDIAGEVMREHKVYYKQMVSLSLSPSDDDNNFIVATFPVPVSFDEASDMNLLFAEKMYSKVDGAGKFIIRFLGEYEFDSKAIS